MHYLKDIQTKVTVETFDCARRARKQAERMNQKYGAIRYVVTFTA